MSAVPTSSSQRVSIIDGRRPSLDMSADRPLADSTTDRLGFLAYATALAELIDNPRTATPLTIAVNAPWGAGKTSLGKLVEQTLARRARERRSRPHAVIWFNAWQHDAAPDLGSSCSGMLSSIRKAATFLVLTGRPPVT